jgi:hypothetical protein
LHLPYLAYSLDKHHCPPKHVAFNADTTNHELYKAYRVEAVKTQKGAYSLIRSHYDPSLLRSTYSQDYHKYPIEPPQPQTKYAYRPNTAKLSAETEYSKSYVPNKVEVQKSGHCGEVYRPSSARFEGTTIYGEQFKGKQGGHPETIKHYAYQFNDLPFNGHTTYGDSFLKYKVTIEKPRTCSHNYVGSSGRFDGHTSYHDVIASLPSSTRDIRTPGVAAAWWRSSLLGPDSALRERTTSTSAPTSAAGSDHLPPIIKSSGQKTALLSERSSSKWSRLLSSRSMRISVLYPLGDLGVSPSLAVL